MSLPLEALGMSPTRLNLVQALSSGVPRTTSELMVDCGLSRNGVLQHLHALERARVVEHRDLPRSHASKPVRHYWVSAESLEELAWAAYDHLVGSKGVSAARGG